MTTERNKLRTSLKRLLEAVDYIDGNCDKKALVREVVTKELITEVNIALYGEVDPFTRKSLR